jgi:hypothetical protein
MKIIQLLCFWVWTSNLLESSIGWPNSMLFHSLYNFVCAHDMAIKWRVGWCNGHPDIGIKHVSSSWFHKRKSLLVFHALIIIIWTSGIRQRSWNSLRRVKYVYVSFTLILGIVGTNPGISIPPALLVNTPKSLWQLWLTIYLCLLFIGKDVTNWFWLSRLFLSAI